MIRAFTRQTISSATRVVLLTGIVFCNSNAAVHGQESSESPAEKKLEAPIQPADSRSGVAVEVRPGGSGETRDSEALIASIEEQLKHAETYYWFGMSELGNLTTFKKGQRHLAAAAEMVSKLPPAKQAEGRYDVRIAGLTDDLAEQIEIAHDTLYGLFPMTRFMVRSIFADATNLGNYELIDDPTVMASTAATRKLALETIREWSQRHQLDVAFTSVPRNPALENESLYLFNSHSKFFVHNAREVADALNDEQLTAYQSGEVTPEIAQSLLDAFKIRDLLIVHVLEIDVVDDDYFYIIAGKIYHANEPAPTHDFAVMGFSRDRNYLFTPIVAMNLFMLALAYAALYVQLRFRQRATVRASVGTLLVLPLLAFAVGRTTPWVVGPLLSSIGPIPETLAIVSFWLPCVAGAGVTVVPMILFWLGCKRLAKIWPMFNIDGRSAALLAGIGAGVAAYFCVPLLVFMPPAAAWSAVAATAITCILLGYLLGRAVDAVDRLSPSVAFAPILLSLFVGAAVFQSQAIWAWGAAGLVGIATAAPIVWERRRRAAPAAEADADAELKLEPAKGKRTAVALHEVADRAERPHYQEPPGYKKYLEILAPLAQGRSTQLGIHGPGGCGLSATANHLVSEMTEQFRKKGVEAISMCGECSHALGEPTPYGPFQKALAQHFEIELLAAPESKLAEIDAALGDVFQSVLPFAGILFPSVGGSAASPTTGEEIVPSITWMLRRLSKTKPVLLLIDDAQWLDKASKSLLKHLLKEFPPDGPDRVGIIVATHEPRTLDELGISVANQAELPFPTQAQQLKILTHGVGLSRPTAVKIVEQLGAYALEQGGLFWLLQIVENLNRNGAFVSSEEGVSLKDGQWPEDVFVPDQMRDVLVQQLRKFPEYRMIIECAACACDAREFNAGLVARALGRRRLELLADLDRIDRETSVLYDIRSADDSFAFQSSFMLEVVRDELRIVDSGPTSGDAPQIIREYHARLAEGLEDSLKTNSNKIYAVANHYYAAGTAKAGLGLKYCLEAARAASTVLDFDAAQHYLRRAEECAAITGELPRVRAGKLDVECRQAHMSGDLETLSEVADAGAEFLSSQPDCSTRLKLSVAQVHYDAGKASGDRDWFERSLAIGEWIIKGAASPQEEAVGRHFVGISLPPNRRGERREQLRKAMEIMASDPQSSDDYELLGRIIGSLAEELSRGDADDQNEAKELFERRIAINDEHKVGDPQGQAMTHGGLGRLAFYAEPKDIATATFHFEKDLEISEAIGDRQGQIQMHSLLGACRLEEDDITASLDHYRLSWELSLDGNPINLFFAGVGLLECHGKLEQASEFQQVAKRLLGLAEDEGVPNPCVEELASLLSLCPAEMMNDDAEELLEIVLAARAKLNSA